MRSKIALCPLNKSENGVDRCGPPERKFIDGRTSFSLLLYQNKVLDRLKPVSRQIRGDPKGKFVMPILAWTVRDNIPTCFDYTAIQ